jgi:hypothetical protein
MGIPTKMFRDAAMAEVMLVFLAHHRFFQYVEANQAMKVSIHYRFESFVVVSKLII